MHHVLGMRADATEDAEHGLHQARQLDQIAVDEMGEVVKVPDVVALELEAGASRRERRYREIDVLEGIAKHDVPGALQGTAAPSRA
jgi:hypothetical protein